MKTTPLLLFIPLLMTSGALAAGQDDFNVQTASSRMVKHEDGSRSYFEKTGDGKGMKKTTYNIRNVLVSVTLYKRGPFGELRSCLIFDGQKNELFFRALRLRRQRQPERRANVRFPHQGTRAPLPLHL